jgi:hypothetical protein
MAASLAHVPLDGHAWFSGATYKEGEAATMNLAAGHGENHTSLSHLLLPEILCRLTHDSPRRRYKPGLEHSTAAIDRLPAVGALDGDPQPGLWVSTGFSSGTVGLCGALCAEVLAAQLGGAMPSRPVWRNVLRRPGRGYFTTICNAENVARGGVVGLVKHRAAASLFWRVRASARTMLVVVIRTLPIGGSWATRHPPDPALWRVDIDHHIISGAPDLGRCLRHRDDLIDLSQSGQRQARSQIQTLIACWIDQQSDTRTPGGMGALPSRRDRARYPRQSAREQLVHRICWRSS